MKDFGLVVIGAHFGVWLSEKISEYRNTNILLYANSINRKNNEQNRFKQYRNIFICTNAVFSNNTKKNFYYVKEQSIPKLGKHWASGIGSFDKQHILNHKSKRFQIQDHDIDKIEIDFITFDDLIEKYKIRSINNLQIDVEGAEYEILNSIDFKKIKIDSIQFESKHFDGTFTEGPKLKLIKDKLSKNGYQLTQIDDENILAKK